MSLGAEGSFSDRHAWWPVARSSTTDLDADAERRQKARSYLAAATSLTLTMEMCVVVGSTACM